MGCFADPRYSSALDIDVVERNYTTMTELLVIPINVPTISDRETLYRGCRRRYEDGSFGVINYSIVDERRPVPKGRVRVEAMSMTLLKELPGSEGEKCECFRLMKFNANFQAGLGFLNSVVGQKAAELIAAPVIKLKKRVEETLAAYTPPEHVVKEVELTWKGGLWRMALEAALGVQYLHHHRYERQARVAPPPSR